MKRVSIGRTEKETDGSRIQWFFWDRAESGHKAGFKIACPPMSSQNMLLGEEPWLVISDTAWYQGNRQFSSCTPKAVCAMKTAANSMDRLKCFISLKEHEYGFKDDFNVQPNAP